MEQKLRSCLLFSHISGMAVGMVVSVCQLKKLKTVKWAGMVFCIDIHGPQMMNLTDFSESLTVPLASP